jgi:ketosteroid isomerase-like protein
MKKIVQHLLPLFLLMLALPAISQNKQQKQIEEKVEQLKKAMIDGDSVMLDKLASSNLVYRHSGGHMDDKKEFVTKLASGQSDFVSIELADQKITLINKKTAIVYHTLDAKTNDGGKPADVHLYVMLVWEKQRGSWKMVGRQAAKKL